MIITVKGGQESGKSARAEEILTELAGPGKMYYVATMIPYGQEGQERVARHRKMRDGKGFRTLEIPVDMSEANTWIDSYRMADHMLRIAQGDTDDQNGADEKKAAERTENVLLECAANLVANLFFGAEIPADEEDEDSEAVIIGPAASAEAAAEAAVKEIKTIADHVDNTVIVTDDYPDQEGYDEETREYIRAIDMVNEALAEISDKVITV